MNTASVNKPLTPAEEQAVKDALSSLADAMGKIGWDRNFNTLSEEEALSVVRACVRGFSWAMSSSTWSDEDVIPY